MKINDELYFNITIGSYTDFLKYSDLLLFRLTEHSGASEIEVELMFRTLDTKIKNLIIANNKIKIDIGPDETHVQTYEVYPYEIAPNEGAAGQEFAIAFTALPNIAYLTERTSESYTGTSKEVMNQICKKYFGKEIKATVMPLETQHTWLRGYKTGAQYMIETMLHMYLGTKGCPIMRIDKDGQAYLYDLDDIKKEGAKYKLVPYVPDSGAEDTYQYLNNFSINTYKDFTNEYTGYGDVTSIKDTLTGKETIIVPEDKPDLAATTELEKALIQNTKVSDNLYQTGNNHANYQRAYKNNTSRLIRLSGVEGGVQIYGFHPEFKTLDMVNIETMSSVDSGLYLVDTKVTEVSYNSPILTTLIVGRDNRNRIEDADVSNENSWKSMLNKLAENIHNALAPTLQAIRNLRRVVVMGRQLVNGHFLWQTIKFLNKFKYNMLTSFSLFGTTLDFNSSLALMDSLKAAGNSFCNQIINAYLPYPFNYAFRNFASERPSLKTVLSKLLVTFSPSNEVQALITEITGLFADLTGTASELYTTSASICSMSEYAQSGYSTGTLTAVNSDTSLVLPNSKGEDMDLVEEQKKIQIITNKFIENTTGADIPIPQLEFSESEALLPQSELEEVLADRTVAYLTEQGYLENVEDFREILVGNKSLDFNTINQINENIGNMLYARYWGSFKTENDITDFFITNSYKDIYVTVPTTKIINAQKGARVFIALPSTERDLIFYINNKEVDMQTIENMDLGLYTISGYPLYYTVYMSEETFNSNSVVLEVRRAS